MRHILPYCLAVAACSVRGRSELKFAAGGYKQPGECLFPLWVVEWWSGGVVSNITQGVHAVVCDDQCRSFWLRAYGPSCFATVREHKKHSIQPLCIILISHRCMSVFEKSTCCLDGVLFSPLLLFGVKHNASIFKFYYFLKHFGAPEFHDSAYFKLNSYAPLVYTH